MTRPKLPPDEALSPARRRAIAIAAGWVVAWIASPAEAQVATSERRVKAAFLFRFAEYVEWPQTAFADDASPLTFAVIGDDRFARELKDVVGDRRIGGRPVDVRTLGEQESTKGVHVLFIPGNRRAALANATEPDDAVLVVTDFDHALAHGATINFVVTGTHVGFEVSLEDASRRQLRLGSRLLSVARNIRRRPS